MSLPAHVNVSVLAIPVHVAIGLHAHKPGRLLFLRNLTENLKKVVDSFLLGLHVDDYTRTTKCKFLRKLFSALRNLIIIGANRCWVIKNLDRINPRGWLLCEACTHHTSLRGTHNFHTDLTHPFLELLSQCVNGHQLWEVVCERVSRACGHESRLPHSATEELPTPFGALDELTRANQARSDRCAWEYFRNDDDTL